MKFAATVADREERSLHGALCEGDLYCQAAGWRQMRTGGTRSGVALGKCLRQALESGRLKCGILQSASLLQRCPERVLLCLLPVTPNSVCDHALDIHHTLITAFCIEHGIRFLRVNGEDLTRAVTRLTDTPTDCPDSGCIRQKNSALCTASKPDVSCVLIKSPKEGVSFEDEVVLDYYDEMVKSSVYPKPVLSIPG